MSDNIELTEEEQRIVTQAMEAGDKAEKMAIDSIDSKLKAKTLGLMSFESVPRSIQSAMLVGIKEGIKAALEVMIEITAGEMTPEQVAESDADVQRFLAAQRKS